MRRSLLIAFLITLIASSVVLAQDVSFVSQSSNSSASLRGVNAVSDQVCWASGSGGTWLRTVDAGKTWQKGVVPERTRKAKNICRCAADGQLVLA